MTSAFGIEHGYSPIAKRKTLRELGRNPSMQNTRGENTKVGTAAGAGTVGAIGGALGATVGTSEARGGLKALRSVGINSSRGSAFRTVAVHGGRSGGKVGAAGAAIGGVYGAALGAIQPARKKRRATNGKS